MTEKEKKFLSDMLNSIELIEDFTRDLKSFTDYQKDLKTKGAVERHPGIIGEAVNKFLRGPETHGSLTPSSRFTIHLSSIGVHFHIPEHERVVAKP